VDEGFRLHMASSSPMSSSSPSTMMRLMMKDMMGLKFMSGGSVGPEVGTEDDAGGGEEEKEEEEEEEGEEEVEEREAATFLAMFMAVAALVFLGKTPE